MGDSVKQTRGDDAAWGATRAQVTNSMGETLHRLRSNGQLTLQRLSERSGVSTGTLSQIERGVGNPAILTLVQIATALDVPVGAFLQGVERNDPVVHRSDRRRVGDWPHVADLDAELLTPANVKALEVMLLRAAPGHDTAATPFKHTGFEFGYVIEGIKDVYLDGTAHRLEAGDSITYSSSVPHWYANPGDETSVSLWVMV